jgi:hypothetical protein
MMAINDKNTEQEWRALFAQLSSGRGAEPLPAASMFDEPSARKRVGDFITKAVLGEAAYEVYRLYYGNTSKEL